MNYHRFAALALLLTAPAVLAGDLVLDHATLIADPKLPGGGPHYALHLSPGSGSAQATMEVLQGPTVLATPWVGNVSEAAVTILGWDGRDDHGAWCSTGNYTVRFSAPGMTTLDVPLDVVRLGVVEMEANDSPAGDDEFPMVYFRKGGTYSYYATPQIHEYANLAPAGEVSDLDQDDGAARAVVPVHSDTATPVLDAGGNYETATYNYPLAYVMGTSPRLELKWGVQGTTSDGQPMAAGYPVAGFDLRAVVRAGGASIATAPITPGGLSTVDLDALPTDVQRNELNLRLRWQYSLTGSGNWVDIPGERVIPLRIYTLLAAPTWKAGASGTRYAGPWVEVAEYVATWKDVLGLPSYGERTLTSLFVQGFVGQNGGLEEALEGVVYDCYPMGGDGGATHYFSNDQAQLSRLLWGHANGK